LPNQFSGVSASLGELTQADFQEIIFPTEIGISKVDGFFGEDPTSCAAKNARAHEISDVWNSEQTVRQVKEDFR
jgi:hypothetical protein